MIKRLRIKFVCINMALVTVMLCAMLGMVLSITSANLARESIQMMHSVAMDPRYPGRPDEVPNGVRLPYFALKINKMGQLIATGGGYYDLSDQAFLDELIQRAFACQEQTGVLRDYRLRFCRVSAPDGQYLVFADMSSELSTIRSLVQNCVMIGTVSFLIFLCISLALARWAVRPVDEAWSQQRQFVADASHELKTPLTVILTNAQLLQSGGYDAAERARFAENILIMSQQMRELTERLLDLARIDSGISHMSMSPVDMSRLVSSAALPFEPLCYEQGLELDCQTDEGVTVQASQSHLRQVVEILLDNAQKYAAPGAKITVRLRRWGVRACLLSVSNPGPPISKEDLHNIFKRFYRADKARSRDGSYGLGLAIAEEIVTAHKGKIWAESTQGINTFFVRLPATAN